MISIIGAGPIGAYLAGKLAKEGEEVRLFEEHENIGRPVQCAGIVSKNIRNFVRIDKEFVLNVINGARIYSPNGECFEIKGNKEAYVLDRAKFDNYLDPLQLSARFVKVDILKDYPKMLINIKEEEWQYFFTQEAKKLSSRVIK